MGLLPLALESKGQLGKFISSSTSWLLVPRISAVFRQSLTAPQVEAVCMVAHPAPVPSRSLGRCVVVTRRDPQTQQTQLQGTVVPRRPESFVWPLAPPRPCLF